MRNLCRFLFVATLLVAPHGRAESPLSLTTDDGRFRLTHAEVDQASIRWPAEGAFSIGTGWRDNAPTHWHHGRPDDVERRGEWTIVTGAVQTGDGTWKVRDIYRVTAQGTLQAKRRWQYAGDRPSGPVVLSIRYLIGHQGDSRARPLSSPESTITETHRARGLMRLAFRLGRHDRAKKRYTRSTVIRYRLPPLNMTGGSSRRCTVGLRCYPLRHVRIYGGRWGLVYQDSGIELTLRSGPTASGGRRGIVKARQRQFLPYENAHLIGVEPGSVIEKPFALQLAPAPDKGSGFRVPLWTSIDWFDPQTDRSLPRPADVITGEND